MRPAGTAEATGVPRAGHDPDAYGHRGWWRRETFLDDLRRQAAERPHKLAVAGRRIAESRTDTLDYAELDRLADRFAAALLELGVRRGDFVAVQLSNRWEIVPLIFACARAGAVICPIAPVCPSDDLRHRLEVTGARVAITLATWQDVPVASVTTALLPELPALEHVFVVDGPVPEGARDFHGHFVAVDREERWGRDLDGLALGPDDPFVVLFTSGTTGPSKAVLHSQNTIHAAIRGYTGAFGLGDGLVAALSSPLCHYSGFAQGVLAGVMLGGTVVFQDAGRSEALLDLVERYGATLLYGPPPTIAAVTAAQRARPRDTSSLRHVVIGTAPVLRELADEVAGALGARAYSLWGMSENGPVTMTRPEDPEGWAAHSNGSPIDAMEIRIEGAGAATGSDSDSGAATGSGSGSGSGEQGPVGRLKVRGASLCLGYHRREDLFAAEFGPDGWFDTGDLARDDGRGGIRILGRARDAIVRDGRIAPVAELEALIGSHPRAVEAAVVGMPGAAGEEICAVVVPSGGVPPSLGEVVEHLRKAGADERFLPERVVAVEALPKTLTGKVRKAELRTRYARP